MLSATVFSVYIYRLWLQPWALIFTGRTGAMPHPVEDIGSSLARRNFALPYVEKVECAGIN